MIYIYGDSHANNSFKNLPLLHNNFYENSITMFRVGRDRSIIKFDKEGIINDASDPKYIRYAREVKYPLLNRILIVVSYGEIDCRCHINRQINLQRDEDDIIWELVNKYIDTIIDNTAGLDAKIVVVGVIPPTKRSDYEDLHGQITHEFPFLGSDQDRVRYTQKTNRLLEVLSKKNNLIYFNPYLHYTRDDGTLKYELSDNTVHLGDNSYFLKKFVELYISLVEEDTPLSSSCLIN